MAAHVGVTNLNGVTAPTTGAVQSSQYEETRGYEKERGQDGNSKYLVPHKYIRKEVRVSGVGDAELAAAIADVGAKAKGAMAIIRAKQDEFQSALPKFEIVGAVLSDIPA